MDTTSLFRGVIPFVAVAEELSYRAAAARLSVSVAAVSKAVKGLEEELGVVLLQRTSRAVSLTPEGQSFLARCQEAMSALKDARREATDARFAPQGKLIISASFIVAPYATRALQILSQRYPALEAQLSITDRLARFVEEDVDVALRVGALQDSTLAMKRLRQNRWSIVASPSYLSRAGVPNAERDLLSHRCLHFLAPNGKTRAWALRDASITLPEVTTIDHGPSLLDAALCGLGLVQVLDFMARDYIQQGQLLEVLPESSTEGPDVYALYIKGRQRNANVRVLLDALGQVFT
jgi:LysR family transcriptional regulator for bpeEF and oprC